MTYLLDANVFIQSKNLHYGFDFCPAFWTWLDARNAAGTVFSIDRVRSELTAGADELATWASERDGRFFLPEPVEIVDGLRAASAWVREQAYETSAQQVFFQGADYLLIAHAAAASTTVVTYEVPAPGSKKRIKIPDVCRGLRVPCVSPYQMLRSERARFVLPSDPA